MVAAATGTDTSYRLPNFIRRSDGLQVEMYDTLRGRGIISVTRLIRYDSLRLQAIERSGGHAPEKVVALAAVLRVPDGTHYQVQLPDGNNIWLNAGSVLTIDPGYGRETRSMELEGEAYFEIKGDHRYPFIVKAGTAMVEVLGTSFIINCYPDEPATAVTLLQGAVQVSDPSKTMQLKEKEQVLITAEGPVTGPADTDRVLAWKEGYLDFDNVSLLHILRAVGRWYGVTVQYQGMRPAAGYSCRLRKNMSLEQVQTTLQQIELQTELKGRKLIVRPI